MLKVRNALQVVSIETKSLEIEYSIDPVEGNEYKF